MSLWADYQRERAGKYVLEEKDGFAVYSYPTPQEVWIEDIYVVPSERKSGYATQLADAVCRLAKQKGAEFVLGSVWVGAKGATDSMKVLLSYGMQLSHIEGNLIVFVKNIPGGDLSAQP